MQSHKFYLFLHVLLGNLIGHLQAWMMVSKTGDITLLGPLEINPGGSIPPRVTFKSASRRQWDMFVDTQEALSFKIRWQEKVTYATIDVRDTNTFSVYNTLLLGSSLSISKVAQLGNTLSVYHKVTFGSHILVLDFFRLESALPVRSFF
jgi:hypothetical protein